RRIVDGERRDLGAKARLVHDGPDQRHRHEGLRRQSDLRRQRDARRHALAGRGNVRQRRPRAPGALLIGPAPAGRSVRRRWRSALCDWQDARSTDPSRAVRRPGSPALEGGSMTELAARPTRGARVRIGPCAAALLALAPGVSTAAEPDTGDRTKGYPDNPVSDYVDRSSDG